MTCIEWCVMKNKYECNNQSNILRLAGTLQFVISCGRDIATIWRIAIKTYIHTLTC